MCRQFSEVLTILTHDRLTLYEFHHLGFCGECRVKPMGQEEVNMHEFAYTLNYFYLFSIYFYCYSEVYSEISSNRYIFNKQ